MQWTASADAKTFTVEPGKAATCPADTVRSRAPCPLVPFGLCHVVCAPLVVCGTDRMLSRITCYPLVQDLFPDKATTILTTPFPATGSEWSGRPGFRIEYFKNYKVHIHKHPMLASICVHGPVAVG